MFTVSLDSAAQTWALGQRLGLAALAMAEGVAAPGGVIVALIGDLGAGKTVFAQGVGRALDAEGEVLSPTFVLIAEHAGRRPLLHADLYRVAEGEIEGLGLEEALERWPGVALIEWADRFPEILPPDHLEIRLEHAAEGRIARVCATGPRHAALAGALQGAS